MNPDGRLAHNLLWFGRLLRTAGLPIGTGTILDAIEAVETVGIGTRMDLYWTLHAVFVRRQDHKPLFDQAFHLFWRNPDLMRRMMAMMLPQVQAELEQPGTPMARRLEEALEQGRNRPPPERPEEEETVELRFDATLTWSEQERLQGRDFEKMSLAELAQAKRLIKQMRLPVPEMKTRRFAPDPNRGRIDFRRTLRQTVRAGGDTIEIARRRTRTRPAPLVAITDISGSMDRYARMLLHFLHAITNDRDRVHTFLFGTRLTNITRHLSHRDVDVALERVADAASDWAGGTRIGACLDAFNRHWSRRVLGQGAVVLLITDGLDRDAGDGLAEAMERLHKSCRRLIWLNPLLRFDGFAPKSAGVRAMMPHVDEFRPIHSLDSLTALADSLVRSQVLDRGAMARWRKEAA